jgi:hypothetical protein
VWLAGGADGRQLASCNTLAVVDRFEELDELDDGDDLDEGELKDTDDDEALVTGASSTSSLRRSRNSSECVLASRS